MKEKKEEKSQPFRERVLQASQLPRDVVMGLPVLYVLGQSELHLENYRGILEYTEEMAVSYTHLTLPTIRLV